ncbi:MAG: EamA family transporter [Bacilli bacterium]|nr:EamA family transporter [Bacilli bacterium]
MWFLCTLLTFISWGIADLFYKIGNRGNNKYDHLKTGIAVGVVMGIHATIYLLINHVNVSFIDLIKYLPVSLCYIASMVIGYKGLRYLELSICSPIQNTSGVITAILLLIFFKETLSLPAYIAILLIFIGIVMLSIIQLNENKEERVEYKKNNTFKRILTLTILFPLAYCFIDGLGTFLDGIYLDYGSLISEDAALVSYEYTFLIYGIITYIYLRTKNEKVILLDEKSKLLAAIFETIGQFFYVFAMSGSSVIAAPIVGSYCILSMLLSRVFLKEKLTKKEYVAIFLVIIGIIILGILDI